MQPLELAKILTNACIKQKSCTPCSTDELCEMFNSFYDYFINMSDLHLNEGKVKCALDITLCLIEQDSCFERSGSVHESVIQQFNVILENIFSKEPKLTVDD